MIHQVRAHYGHTDAPPSAGDRASAFVRVRATTDERLLARSVAEGIARAVVLGVAPELFCGHPHGLAGDGQPLRGPWRLPAAMPNRRDRLEVCARVTACSVRAAGAPRDATWQSCWKARVDRTGPCAGLLDCAEVARCFRELP